MNQNELPYPGLQFAYTKRGGRHYERLSDAITAGSAQYPEGYLRRGGRIADSEGVLCFWDEGVAFYADSGMDVGWRYDDMAGFSVSRGALAFLTLNLMRSLTLSTRSGSGARFKIGKQLAANADRAHLKLPRSAH